MLKTIMSGVATDDWASAPPSVSIVDRVKALLPTWSKRDDRAVEHFIMNNGGVLTDALEREISQRFGGHAGR